MTSATRTLKFHTTTGPVTAQQYGGVMSTAAEVTCEIDPSCSIVTISAAFPETWLDEVIKLYLLSFLLIADKVLADDTPEMQSLVRSTGYLSRMLTSVI